jgi:type I restriction enzyme S subunit
MAGDSKVVARAHLADAGVEELPDDWDVVTLGDLFTEDRGIAVGVMYPGDHVPDGVPLIKAGDLNGSIINPQPDFRISKEKHHEYRRTALEGGELLMTLVGNVGQCAVVPSRMAGWNTARAVAVMRLADSSETQFVQQCLLSRPLQHLMDVWCNTTVQATLNLKEIRQLPLPWPPKQSRDAIAAFGKALDDKIELNRRMNATLEAMARALFQSWFVDFDPVRAKLDGHKPTGLDTATAALFPAHLQDSPLGHIPQGWTVGKIQDCCTQIQNGGTPRRDVSRYWDGGNIPWLASGEVRQSIITSTESFITEDGLKESSAKWIPAHSIVVALYGATAGQVSFVSSPLTTNQAVCALLPKKNFEFFNYLTMLNSITELENKAVGSAQQNISKGIVEETQVILPPTSIIEAFTKLVSPLFDIWVANLRQSRTLATLRDTLLPKLLSGERCMSSQVKGKHTQ